MARDEAFLAAFDGWCDAFAAHVAAKGEVPPGRYRAFGYEPPRHRWADARLKWRELRMKVGHARKGSSPAEQSDRGLNRDEGRHALRSEGEKLREGAAAREG